MMNYTRPLSIQIDQEEDLSITIPSEDEDCYISIDRHPLILLNDDVNFSNNKRRHSLAEDYPEQSKTNFNNRSRSLSYYSNNNVGDEEEEELLEEEEELLGEEDTTSPSGSPTSSASTGTTRSSGSSSSTTSSGRRKKKKKHRGYFAKMWYSSPEEHTLLKIALWFPVGILLSLALYYAILDGMDMEIKTKRFLGAAIGIILSLSFAFSIQMRCAMTLVIPTLAGKAGRTYISAFAIIYLINGPITNILSNGKEIVRSLSCTASLLANHTLTKWKLRLAPVEHAFGDVAKDGYIIKRVSNAIKRAFKPLTKEVQVDEEETKKLLEEIAKARKLNPNAFKGKPDEGEDGEPDKQNNEADEQNKELGKRVEKDWAKKMDLRCEGVFNKGFSRCVDKMGQLYGKCIDKLWIVGYLLCWPLKITGLCNLVKLIPGAFGMSCKAVKVVYPGFGETYIAANAVIEDMDKGMDVKMQYKIVGDLDALDYTPVEEMRQAAIHEVSAKTDLLRFLFSLVAQILTFVFLLVFKSAYDYNKKYLTDLNFDNKYITPYYRHIDARRHAEEKKTLLPLKKYETKEFIDPAQLKLTGAEKKHFASATVKLLVRVFISAIICYMDSMLYQVLDIIARNSKVEYHEEGEHVIDVKVYGTGFMSELVRNFLTRFNSKHQLDRLTTNHACLPNPSKTDLVILTCLFLTYLVVWMFLYLEAFSLRLRRVIASFYYRKREKKRVLYLYNEMFRKRIGYLGQMRKKVRKAIKARELQNKVGVIVALQRYFPTLCKCLKVIKSAKEHCVICNDPEDSDFHICSTKGCRLAYCKNCWKDVKRRCYGCGRNTETKDADEDTSGDTDTSEMSDASDDSGIFDD
ncbi:E3 ubiquitin-protein ligase DCST1 [Biomphalaria glabrata]|nr:E3 ubiquitin-protein ligase DCST1 [Biomphalaria glabrata]